MNYLFFYLKRILVLLALYQSSRIYFFFNNRDSFIKTNILEILEGCRFDLSALVYINIPFFILLLTNEKFKKYKHYQKVIKLVFYITNIPFLVLNNIDIEYFRFTQKRITFDFFNLIFLGSDIKNIIFEYIIEYWKISLFTIIQILIIFKLKFTIQKTKKEFIEHFTFILLGVIFLIIGARGGLQLKPIKPINAGELSKSKNSSLILSTPFCVLHSLKSEEIKKYEYFSDIDLKKIYRVNHIINKRKKEEIKPNIVIIIMESFSKEFIGFYNNGIGQTPFLDSLMQNSLVFTNAFANGIKSIEALPAITASIPALMNEPFITSKYAENKFESLANILNKENYSTSFYHGGNRGTMGFYAFCQKAGFKNYYGLEEYDNDKDFDGSWGIYDEPFLQYFATQIKKEKNPFFTTFFSLSSHPPYTVPKNDEFENKKIGILETIRYSDNALKLYFEKIKKEKWFENTIFVITADHTAGPRYDKKYMNKIGKYAIPLIIFKGDNSIRGVNKKIVQHIDILPTILDIINYSKPFFSFGKSVFDEEQWAIFKIQDKYFFITKNEIIRNTEERYNGFLDWELNQKIKLEKKSINKLKAIKQVYNNRMSNNKIHYED